MRQETPLFEALCRIFYAINLYKLVTQRIQYLLAIMDESRKIFCILTIVIELLNQRIQFYEFDRITSTYKLLAQNTHLLSCLYTLDKFFKTCRTASIRIHHIGITCRPGTKASIV